MSERIKGRELRAEALDPKYLAELFRETKKAHLKYQEDAGTKAPWVPWYAEHVSNKLHEAFGDETGRLFNKERLEKVLDDAENTHSAGWPEWFGLFVMDKLGPRIDALEDRDWSLDAPYLAELLKETKREHLAHQKKMGTNVPWAPWYAEYISHKIQQKFGGKIGEIFEKENLEKVLDDAENEHSVEWPEYFGVFVKENIKES